MVLDIDLKGIVYGDGLKRTTCDTLEEIRTVKNKLGDRYKATWRVEYPDATFYIVGYTPE